MNIFDNLRQYQKPPRKFQPPTEEEIRQEKRKKHLEWLKGSVLAVLFTSFWGCLWYFAKWKFAGMIFFLVLAFLIFGIFTTSFANGSDWLEKKFGNKVGLNIGCLGMALGPILGISLFVTSIPYWNLKERERIECNPTVYVTPYGECYHSSENCYTIQGHRIKAIQLYKAERQGRRPCEICSFEYIKERTQDE